MTYLIQRCLLLLLPMVVAITVVGCQDRNSVNTSSLDASRPRETESEHKTQEGAATDRISPSDKRKAVAEKAKEALFTQLSQRLLAVMQTDGPAEAIEVCSKEAVTIAEAVGKKHGVKIGRTSFKLRNSANAPRDWVKPFVENRTDTSQYVQLDDGSLGALFPIHLNVKCLMCHGQPDDILDAVKPKLAKLYPNDEATGFKLDELRGWFWVEVPENATQLTSTVGKQWQALPIHASVNTGPNDQS
jgi:hypothetical protein